MSHKNKMTKQNIDNKGGVVLHLLILFNKNTITKQNIEERASTKVSYYIIQTCNVFKHWLGVKMSWETPVHCDYCLCFAVVVLHLLILFNKNMITKQNLEERASTKVSYYIILLFMFDESSLCKQS